MSDPFGGISADEVRRIARLASLELSEAEVGAMTRQMGNILNYFKQLQALDTSGVPPTAHALDLLNALRNDQPRPSLPREDALRNAPEEDSGHFKVPAVL